MKNNIPKEQKRRNSKLLKMREQGLTYKALGKEFKISEVRAFKIVKKLKARMSASSESK